MPDKSHVIIIIINTRGQIVQIYFIRKDCLTRNHVAGCKFHCTLPFGPRKGAFYWVQFVTWLRVVIIMGIKEERHKNIFLKTLLLKSLHDCSFSFFGIKIGVTSAGLWLQYGEAGQPTMRTWLPLIQSRHILLWNPRTSKSQILRHLAIAFHVTQSVGCSILM